VEFIPNTIFVASVLNILDNKLIQKVGNYILSCQTYEEEIAWRKKLEEEKPTCSVPDFFSKEYLDFHQSSEETLVNGRSNRSRNRRR
jgi:hypothetical protein